MNYSELMALSRVGLSADGICCYRVSPLEREDAEVMVVGVKAMDSVQDAWVDALPNSQRVCMGWLPSNQQAQNEMFDAFMDGEIEKGYALWLSGDWDATRERDGALLIRNTKTKTECRIKAHDTSRCCFQGQRAGCCKHRVTACIEGLIEDQPLMDCINQYLLRTGAVSDEVPSRL